MCSVKRFGIEEREIIRIAKEKGWLIPTISETDKRIDYVKFFDIVNKLGYELTRESKMLQDNGKCTDFYYQVKS